MRLHEGNERLVGVKVLSLLKTKPVGEPGFQSSGPCHTKDLIIVTEGNGGLVVKSTSC